jgi:hypothetical protein
MVLVALAASALEMFRWGSQVPPLVYLGNRNWSTAPLRWRKQLPGLSKKDLFQDDCRWLTIVWQMPERVHKDCLIRGKVIDLDFFSPLLKSGMLWHLWVRMKETLFLWLRSIYLWVRSIMARQWDWELPTLGRRHARLVEISGIRILMWLINGTARALDRLMRVAWVMMSDLVQMPPDVEMERTKHPKWRTLTQRECWGWVLEG